MSLTQYAFIMFVIADVPHHSSPGQAEERPDSTEVWCVLMESCTAAAID